MTLSQPVRDQRRDMRHVAVLIVGRVRSERGEFACVVKDVSRGGLHARFPYPPRVGERLTFVLRDMVDRHATVKWVAGNCGGVAFDRPVDPAAILDGRSEGRPARSPRFPCKRLARLLAADRDHAFDLIDVSLGGAKLGRFEAGSRAIVGRAGTLILPAIDLRRAGTVRWDNGGAVGFQFVLPLTIDALADLLTRLSPDRP